MGGLLYQDFVAVCGKRIAAGLLLITLLLLLFSAGARSEEGILIVGALVICASLILPLTVPLFLESAIFTADAGKKKKAYLLSLPVSRRQYIASKYLFIGIAYYVVLSVTALWGIFVSSAMEQVLKDTPLTELFSLIPLYICVCMVLSALELPFFAVLGVKAGNALKQGILLILFFLTAAYLLFGDLHIPEKYHLMGLPAYMQEHMEIALLLQTLGPVAAILGYYLSYRIAAALSDRKEPGDEE